MNTEQKRHEVIIDERKELFDVAEQRVSKTTRENRFEGKLYGASPLTCVLMAYKKCEKNIVDMDMIEVEVDGCPFPG